jgi:hypothetical protein
VIAAAASDTSGHARFATDLLSGATGSLEQTNWSFNDRHYARPGAICEVKVVRLDDFLDLADLPGLIKIDVEGAELAVLAGATRVLSEVSPILFFESFGKGRACSALLELHGYRCFDSDRCATATEATTNFLALVPARCPPPFLAKLRALGYPLGLLEE